jgi:hypothetical protein
MAPAMIWTYGVDRSLRTWVVRSRVSLIRAAGSGTPAGTSKRASVM